MDEHLKETIRRAIGASGDVSILGTDRVQSLWSGYGEILRVRIDAGLPSVIVKHVAPPTQTDHPRGWATDRSHNRKLRSYNVEAHWYSQFSGRCKADCRVPKCLLVERKQAQTVFVLEDLDAAGFSHRKSALDISDVKVCIRWLAEFHATFLSVKPKGLWPVGTYWHLDTRPDEWKVMPEGALKAGANQIDDVLKNCEYQTLVHGDAKVANFCFADNGKDVAAVDFQYVGGGCGMKDLMYFLGSSLTEEDCDRFEKELLDCYFDEFGSRLALHHPQLSVEAIEQEWRGLYCFACADFNRFLAGWCPGHHKLTGYSQRVTQKALDQI